MSDLTKRAARLADALLADRNREPAETQSTTCEACGRGMVDRGQRCCSERCEQWLVDGNPPHGPGFARKVLDMSIRGWVVIAGPPGVEIGSRPYAELLNAIAEKRTRRGGRAAPRKTSAISSRIEGADRARSPRISRRLRELHNSLPPIVGPAEVIGAELGALKARGADGLVLPDQEWTRRVSPDEVTHYVAKSLAVSRAAPATPNARCLACGRRADTGQRFCAQACRTAFDEDAEPHGDREVLHHGQA
jgi:predicted nucleic acid-binding Zn ribbon protein